MRTVIADRIRTLSHDTLARAHGTGLLVIIFASFFPPLIHAQVYLFFGLLALSATVAWAQGRALWVRTDIDVPLLLLIGWILLTVPFAADPAYSFTEWRKLGAQGLMFYWCQFVLHNFKKQAMIRHVVLTVAVGAVVLGVAALIMFVMDGGSLLDRPVRAKALFSDSNWLCTYMVISIPIVGSGLAIADLRRWKVFLAGVLGIAIVVMYCSFMRAGWLALATMGISWGVLIKNPRLTWCMFGVCIGSLALIVLLHQFGFFKGIINSESVLFRFDLWAEGVRRLLVHPIVGSGYGQLASLVEVYAHQELGSTVTMQGMHSLFLMIAVGSGVPALIMLLWLFQRSVRVLAEKSRAGVDLGQRAIAAGAALMVIGFAVRSMFDYMFTGGLAYLFWILLAFGLGSHLTGDNHAVMEGRQAGIAR